MLLKSEIGTLIFCVLLTCHIQHYNWHNKTKKGPLLTFDIEQGHSCLDEKIGLQIEYDTSIANLNSTSSFSSVSVLWRMGHR